MIRIRIFQILFFFPCCIVDGFGLFLIHVPLWIFTGVEPVTKESYLEWLFKLPEYIKDSL